MAGEFSKISVGAIIALFLGFIGIILLFQMGANTIPEVQTATGNLNDSSVCGSAGCFWNNTDTTCRLAANQSTSGCPGYATGRVPLGNASKGLITMVVIMLLVLSAVIGAFKLLKK